LVSRRAGAEEIMNFDMPSGCRLSSTRRSIPSIITKWVGVSEVKVDGPVESSRSRCSGSKLARL